MFWWEDPLWQGPAQQEDRFTRQDIIGEKEGVKNEGKNRYESRPIAKEEL